MKLKAVAVLALLMASGSQAYAGNFVTLTSGSGGNLTVANGGIKNGAQNVNADSFYIETTSATYLAGYNDTTTFAEDGLGNIVETSINYRTYTGGTTTGTGTLTLLDWRETTGVTLLPGVAQGNIYDFVYRDSTDNSLVFGTRFLNTVDNNQEVNFMFRNGLSGYSTATAWTFTTDSDLRLYQAAKTSNFSYDNTVAYNANSVRMKGDFSVSEGNPWSGLFLVKTNATSYSLANNSISIYQAGEEGQSVVGNSIAGFAPTTVAAIPEADTYAMLLAGLGIMGFVARRKVS